MKITTLNKKELFSRGWTLVDMGFSKKEIKKYLNATNRLKQKAIKNNYPLLRCYYPHLFHLNIAAVESPFNKLICNSDIKDFFLKLEIGKCLQELLGWSKSYLHLARLFTMNRYNYMGDWHRDFDIWDGNLNKLETIQIGLYLKDQDGFRILKYPFDKSSKSSNSIKFDPGVHPYLPAKLEANYFDEIKGKEGMALFFAPGIMHQGNSRTNRLDYHLRFSKLPYIHPKQIIPQSKMYDFYSPNFYLENFDIANDFVSPRMRKISFKERLINSANYNTGFKNILYHLKYIFSNDLKNQTYPNPWDYELFANTRFQN